MKKIFQVLFSPPLFFTVASMSVWYVVWQPDSAVALPSVARRLVFFTAMVAVAAMLVLNHHAQRRRAR